MWEAYAEYADGTSIRKLFCQPERVSESDRQYDLECWLIERHPDCTFYSVSWIQDEDL